jgi:hypothetical protein
MNYPCGFASVNSGKHCVPYGLEHCVVCGVDVPYKVKVRVVKKGA